MQNNHDLLNHIDQIHTTELGIERIRKNLDLHAGDVVHWCRREIARADKVTRKGKNWYVFAGDSVITVNAHSFTIITAHRASQARYG